MLQQLARLLAPPCCARCDYEGNLVCQDCWNNVFRPGPVHQASVAGVGEVVAAGPYAGELRQLIARLKYRHQREAAATIAKALLPALKPKRFEFDAVTAVPVVSARFRQRGYNQAELIAKRLAWGLALPCSPLLVRLRVTRQVGKSRPERLQQVIGAFAAKPSAKGQRVLLVDDVLTTGATLAACARALKAAGAKEVTAAVAAWD